MSFSLVANGRLIASAGSAAVIPWWSFGKTVLAAAALTLVRDGLLGLDDILPEGPFTLRQLLRHEAGLADYCELPEYHAAVARDEEPWSVDDMLQRLDANRLGYSPGASWQYSNVGYLYVARLIERVTALSLDQALLRQVFAPLAIADVRLAKTRKDMSDLPVQYRSGYHPGWVYHGLLIGTLDNAALLLDRVLSGVLFDPLLLEAMQDRRILGGPIPGRPWTVPGYGLGLMQGEVEGGLLLSGHTGSGPGSVVAVYRSTQANATASCAVFQQGSDQGAVEAEALARLAASLEH